MLPPNSRTLNFWYRLCFVSLHINMSSRTFSLTSAWVEVLHNPPSSFTNGSPWSAVIRKRFRTLLRILLDFFPYRWWGLAVSVHFCKLNFCWKSLASAGFFPAIPPLEPFIFLLSSMIRSDGGKLMLLFDTQNFPSSNSCHDLGLFSCTFSIVASYIEVKCA